MASATLLNATSLSGEGLSANGLTGAVISGGSHHAGLSSSLSGGLASGLSGGLSCNGLSSDNCASNNLSINHSNSSSANLLESSRLDHRPTRSKIALPDINNNANGSSIPGGANAMSQSDLVSANTANASLNASSSTLNPTASSSNPNASSNSNGLNSSSNLNSSNLHQTANLNSTDPTNNQLANSSYSNRSAEMLKIKESVASRSSNSIENSPPDYLLNKKTSDHSNMNKLTAFSSSLYSVVAMDVKVINQDCVIYSYCSDVNTAIEDHFKRALNTSIYSNSNDKHKGKALIIA